MLRNQYTKLMFKELKKKKKNRQIWKQFDTGTSDSIFDDMVKAQQRSTQTVQIDFLFHYINLNERN